MKVVWVVAAKGQFLGIHETAFGAYQSLVNWISNQEGIDIQKYLQELRVQYILNSPKNKMFGTANLAYAQPEELRK